MASVIGMARRSRPGPCQAITLHGHASRTARPLAVGLVLSALVTSHAFAGQAGRAEAIAEQQAEKASRLLPEGPNAGELLVTRVMSSPLLAGAGGVYPWFGSIYPGTGFGTGVGWLRRQPRGGSFTTLAAIGVGGSRLLDVSWTIPAVTALNELRPRVGARWLDAKDVGYYGVGAASSRRTRTLFDHQPTTVEGALDARAGRWLRFSGSYAYARVSTSSDDRSLPGAPLPGLGESIDYGVAGASAALDWRSSRGYSTRGGLVRAAWLRYDAGGGAVFSFDQMEYEVVQLVPLLREQYGLAFRGLVTEARAEPGHEVPFVLLPSIGGGDSVRGLANRRLHDRSRAVVSAEYRWRPSRFLDMALFADSGTVAPRLAALSADRLITAWGIGARLHGPSFTALRVELAGSREGWIMVFTAGQPF